MKRLWVFVLVVLFLLTLAACGTNENALESETEESVTNGSEDVTPSDNEEGSESLSSEEETEPEKVSTWYPAEKKDEFGDSTGEMMVGTVVACDEFGIAVLNYHEDTWFTLAFHDGNKFVTIFDDYARVRVKIGDKTYECMQELYPGDDIHIYLPSIGTAEEVHDKVEKALLAGQDVKFIVEFSVYTCRFTVSGFGFKEAVDEYMP